MPVLPSKPYSRQGPSAVPLLCFRQSRNQLSPPFPARYNPIKTTKTSFLGTMNMLGLAKRCRARFLLTSTSEVYGDPLEHPQTESYWGNVNCIGERSCYDEGKRVAETLTMDYFRCGDHSLDVVDECSTASGRPATMAILRSIAAARALTAPGHHQAVGSGGTC